MADVGLINVSKRFSEVEVLSSIDLAIRHGEFMVLVGPSGCGKSTLLRLIAGLEQPTSGEIRINGRSVNQIAPADRDVAMVFQSYALYPHMTVRRNMRFGLDVRKMPRGEADTAVEQAARMLGLSGLLDRHPRELSGGQRQRVALGRAIVRRPKAFLFDEPLSNLDPELRGQMRVELRRLHQALSATMIYVTHDQVEAMTLADRVAVLDRGRIQQVGSPMELYEGPANRFVARFIGSPQMNIWEARIEAGRLVGDGWSLPAPTWAGGLASVQVGIRPHDLEPLHSPHSTDETLTINVEVIETVGWDAHVHGSLGHEPVVVQLQAAEGSRLGPGASLRVAPKPGRIHLFDPDTGASLRD